MKITVEMIDGVRVKITNWLQDVLKVFSWDENKMHQHILSN